MTILLTGAGGFIGCHVATALINQGFRVLGVDNFNTYYDPRLKEDRVAALIGKNNHEFELLRLDFADDLALDHAIAGRPIDTIVHLGAQPGVRYSILHPQAYMRSNLQGHLNLLEVARRFSVRQFIYASSSSVYGSNTKLPFSVEDRVDYPLSLYAATKKANELMSESYSHLYRIPMTGLRFFTVYGPWGRPDMAVWLFTKAILEGSPIRVFNHGRMRRDFTFIDDIVAGIIACIGKAPVDDGQRKAGGSVSPHRIFNIGNNRSEALDHLIDLIEQACGRPAFREMCEMQPGDVVETFADIEAISSELGFSPRTTIDVGIPKFVDWYQSYHRR